jgi:histidyl-tRNA synthetase
MEKINPPRGTADLLPAEKARHNLVIDLAREVAARYGFADMATPIFEFTEVFSRPLGASSDVVSKETYSLQDRGGASLTLRPEGTAPVMRALLSAGLTQQLPQKLFYSGPMFRYERPQKGRMRQFHQVGAELIGPGGPLADAEIIACGAALLDALGVAGSCVLHLNSLGDSESRQAYRTALLSYLEKYRSDLSADSQRRLTSNPLRILDSKEAADRAIVAEAPLLAEHLNSDSRAHFDQLCSALDAAGISWQMDHRLVRGLDYYCHTAFEFITDGLGAQGTVLGGGRYDGLSEMLGGPALPAVGFAAGVERLALLAAGPETKPVDLAIIAADEESLTACFALAVKCRAAGLAVDLPLSGNLSKKMKRVNQAGVRQALIIGAAELQAGTGQLRDMQSGAQQEIKLQQLPDRLVDLIAGKQ